MTDSAATFVLDEAYEPAYGARPLKRYLEKLLVTELAKLIIKGVLPDNTDLLISHKSEVPPGTPSEPIGTSLAITMAPRSLEMEVEDEF